jgi:hypothetical protein
LKTSILSICLILSLSSIADTCKNKFKKEIIENQTIAEKIMMNEFYYSSQAVFGTYGYFAFGLNPVTISLFFGIPLTLTTGHFLEDAIKDHQLLTMIRLISESEYELGYLERPTGENSIIIKRPETGVDNKEKRQNKKYNKKAVKSALREKEAILRENQKGQKIFTNLVSKIKKTRPEYNRKKIATFILNAEADGSLCNAKMRKDVNGNNNSAFSYKKHLFKAILKSKQSTNSKPELGNQKSSEDCFCVEVYQPVCGENGITYTNECQATCNKVEIAKKNEC